MSEYVIEQARPRDLIHLAEIELAAARLLADYAPESVLVETTPLRVLMAAQADGRLWVALQKDVPVGFAHVEMLESDAPHLEELDVHPAHSRRGLGRRLVIEVCRWAGVRKYTTLTLATFRDVPWNMPFYARLGFEEIAATDLTPALLAFRHDEMQRGLDRDRRALMRYTVPLTT
jgi:GNAT superfamily N-acetyltransferase